MEVILVIIVGAIALVWAYKQQKKDEAAEAGYEEYDDGGDVPVHGSTIDYAKEGFVVKIYPRGFKLEMIDKEVCHPFHFDFTFANNYRQEMAWVKIDFAILFQKRESYGYTQDRIKNGNTVSTYRRRVHINDWGFRLQFPIETTIPNYEEFRVDDVKFTFTDDNLESLEDHFKELIVHQIYGELADGTPVHVLLRDDISFDSEGNYRRQHTSSGCFVTTAAYGDPNHPLVQEFRYLRDTHLIRSAIGRWCMDRYAAYGPMAARVITANPRLQATARLCLTPLAQAIRAARNRV